MSEKIKLVKIIKYVFSSLWRIDKWRTILYLVVTNLRSLFSIPELYLNKLFIETLLAAIAAGSFTSYSQPLLLLVIVRFLVQLSESILSRIGYFLGYQLRLKYQASTDDFISDKLYQLEIPVIESAEFTTRFSRLRSNRYRGFNLANSVISIPSEIASIFSSLALIYILKPWMVLISLLFSLPKLFIRRKLAHNRFKNDEIIQQKYSTRNEVENLLNHQQEEVRTLGAFSFLKEKRRQIRDEINNLNLSSDKRMYLLGIFQEFLDQLFSRGFEIYLVINAILGRITFGDFQAASSALNRLTVSLGNVLNVIGDSMENQIYLSDLMWFIDHPVEPFFSHKNSVNLSPKNSLIKFNHVNFHYPGHQKFSLKNLNFEIKPAEKIALVGLNGAGKSTIVKLLCGFYKPTSGQVSFGSHNIFSYPPEVYRSHLAVLYQNFCYYSVSAKESIGLGNILKLEDFQAIQSVAKLTKIDSWIKSLPQQYQTPLATHYPNGVQPSGGQRQRIALARIMLKSAEVYILDEPTSQVDALAEEEIFSEVLDLLKDKTVIFISHRFCTVRRADRILLIEDGQITENESHEKLMAQNGTYARLFSLQAKSYQ
ncbi:hypothetical protein A2397_05375 [Candidatus Amesbacteria bacterium RIFOXYB1_FULL_44_23]|uniref:ABC transporter domain-containing protein n=1 Tax=Candidatus Amesbacteria bacterium RIFOXYB1_FULL_44_23 TaxID=1797263 RepID=A0A1F4ZSQ8_9BACT|nr:MAG: hypothetical protein A2397_05375 [Candidatus Amesbacteria bacterium RIFOXYB1_FULL_44_23]